MIKVPKFQVFFFRGEMGGAAIVAFGGAYLLLERGVRLRYVRSILPLYLCPSDLLRGFRGAPPPAQKKKDGERILRGKAKDGGLFCLLTTSLA
jgi:hypothetical protein